MGTVLRAEPKQFLVVVGPGVWRQNHIVLLVGHSVMGAIVHPGRLEPQSTYWCAVVVDRHLIEELRYGCEVGALLRQLGEHQLQLDAERALARRVHLVRWHMEVLPDDGLSPGSQDSEQRQHQGCLA